MSLREDAEVEDFDLVQLLQRCLGSVQLAERLLRLYDSQLDGEVEALERAIAEGATQRLASTAHRLKGSAANLGVVPARRTAAEIERRARRGETTELLPLVRRLRDCQSRLRAVLASDDLWEARSAATTTVSDAVNNEGQ